MDDLTPLIGRWPVDQVAVGVAGHERSLGFGGDSDWVAPIASVSKLLTTYAGLVAIEEETIFLDEAAGPEGATVRHLLSHSSGLAFDTHDALASPGSRRIYSNSGIEQFATHLENRAGMPFAEYLTQAVIEPLGMSSTVLDGSPAHGMHSSVSDLCKFAMELFSPKLISSRTLEEATRAQFPDLRGVLPGLGSFDPNPWGLGFEIRANKRPHWTGATNSEQTFGHFGGSGTFLWVDPSRDLACVVLTDRPFGDWALEEWPRFSDAVIEQY